MDKILPPLQKVYPSFDLVSVSSSKDDISKVDAFCNHLLEQENDIQMPRYLDYELHPQPNQLRKHGLTLALDWIFFLDLLNFCFHDVNYQVRYGDRIFTGYAALCSLVQREMNAQNNVEDDGCLLVQPAYYGSQNFDLAEWARICRGELPNSIMPLLIERFEILKQAADCLNEKFDGHFINVLAKVVDKVTGLIDIYELLECLQSNFPSFRDYCQYEDETVYFLKRAQILIADIWSFCEDERSSELAGVSQFKFKNIDHLTMFADYRVPQSLLHFGLISYNKEGYLMDKLKSGSMLEYGSREEVQIRGASILAVDAVVKRLKEKKGEAKIKWNAILIDFYLWNYAKSHSEELKDIPIHRTISHFY